MKRLTRALHPPRRGRHRDVRGSGGRAAVLGAGDGLLTNVSLILGVAGAHTSTAAVRLSGVAGLLAGAFSMAAGELVSVRAQDELVQTEVDVERQELRKDPKGERRELAQMYRSRGVARDDADTLARIVMSNAELALDTHAQLELGVGAETPPSARTAAIASFLSFAIGALIPLAPWFFVGGTTAFLVSVVGAAAAALALGAAIGTFTGHGPLRTAVRQLLAATVAAAVTYGVGRLLGTQNA